jgi:1-acyl-sn-glycerol-3-phosphate acyltransferase
VNWLFYYISRFGFYILIRMLFRLRVYGSEHIPSRKPYIICSNHISWIDPLTVGVGLPARIKIHYMAKKELFNNFILKHLLLGVGAFPVNRHEADYGAIKKAYQLLKEEQVIGMFPEGTRSTTGEIRKAYNGAALIAVRSGVPILPVAIDGTYRLFSPLKFYIGKPIVMPPLVYDSKEEKKALLNSMSCDIMHNIGNHSPSVS